MSGDPLTDQDRTRAALGPGTRLGDFELHESLGSGAMGDVYHAVDRKLGREVAIKVLSPLLAANEDGLRRFENEAKLLASLGHPNIAQLYDFREEAGLFFLVMELARGETLKERLRIRPLTLDEGLRIFIQIAEALEAAHELGITHRDLKPENVKIDAQGKVKVLDFGLAKYIQTGPFTLMDGSVAAASTPSDLTKPGLIVGTPSYMSPEQARGEKVDKRSDIWAFGCCMFEALTGTPPFKDENLSDTLANVLNREPDWGSLPADTPVSVEFLLRRCLEKDKKKRLRDIGDGIQELTSAQSHAALPYLNRYSRYRALSLRRPARAVRWLTAAALLAAVFVAGNWWGPASREPGDRPAAYALAAPLLPDQQMDTLPRSVVLSPNGQRLAYVAYENGATHLYVREMSSEHAEMLRGTEGARMPFFSPDGEWIGFFSLLSMKKIPARGGTPVTILRDVPGGYGGAWLENGTIIFNRIVNHGLCVIPADGGDVEVLTDADGDREEIGHWFPRALPGDRAVLFTCYVRNYDNPHLEVLTLADRTRSIVLRGAVDARYIPTGHLVFTRDTTLHAAPFDLATLQVTGSAIPVLHDVRMGRAGRNGLFDVAPNGTLVYAESRPGAVQSRLVEVDENGDVLRTLNAPPGDYGYPRYSKDGEDIAVRVAEGTERQIYLYEARGIPRRLTFEGESNFLPVWDETGDAVLFASDREGVDQIYRVNVHEDRPPERFLGDEHTSLLPGSSVRTNRGSWFTYVRQDKHTLEDIYVVDCGQPDRPIEFVSTPFRDASPVFSPDGRWIAYISNKSGRWQVYARRFPDSGKEYQLSSDGGMEPVWSRDGQRLYYRNGDTMMAVDFRGEDDGEPAIGEPTALFEGEYRREWNLVPEYDVYDGKFLLVKTPRRPDYYWVRLHWFDDLRRQLERTPRVSSIRHETD